MLALATEPQLNEMVRGLLLQAAAVAGERSTERAVRRRMAHLVCVLSDDVQASEESCSAAMRAASANLDDHVAVRELLDAAARLAPSPAGLVVPIRRLCAAAHAARLRSTTLVCLAALVRLDEFDGGVPEEWLASVVEVPQQLRLQSVALTWIRRFGAGPGLRTIVLAHEDWLLSPTLPMGLLREIHAHAPTASGWRALAARRDEVLGHLGISFGDRRGEAIEALREAMDGAMDDAVRVVLARWLTEIAS